MIGRIHDRFAARFGVLKSRRGDHAGHCTRANLDGTNADENTSALFDLQSVTSRDISRIARTAARSASSSGRLTARADLAYFLPTILKSRP